ncbi:hypothetical protein ILUMI_04703 [Ignelater luminosus]|uniref:aralkylamine N-acetyltransferase n=1 Tax=Ignelater luminosus TaxID=2038154 RepID=A0A8K0D8N2_IGNLU|nr:hypothetical protein ILUMI_04703 [Ignelater luminosus]
MSTPSTPTSPTEPYEIKDATKEDSENILVFLRKFFFRDEPLNTSIQLIESENAVCMELEEFSLKSLYEGISLIATTTSGKIVGVCLNGILKRDDPEEELHECSNPKFAKILKLLDKLEREGNVFGQFPDVNKVLTVKVLSVDNGWRGKGIAKELMNKTRNIAREQGCGLMRVDCSSYFSARAIASLGFDCVYSLKYDEYKENGEIVFNTEEPHREARIYVQRLSS